jgi:putative FmdB family regulatory protein
MPLYEYECDACGQRFEVIQKFTDPTPDACEKCGKGPVRRLMSSPAIQFKGSGFYITDYAKKSSSESGSSKGKSDSGKSDGGGESKSESKSDSSASSDSSSTKSDSSASSTSTTAAPAATKKD